MVLLFPRKQEPSQNNKLDSAFAGMTTIQHLPEVIGAIISQCLCAKKGCPQPSLFISLTGYDQGMGFDFDQTSMR